MTDKDRFKFLFGPHETPRCKIGGTLRCSIRGTVEVRGTTMLPTNPYRVKLEGASPVGYRTISIAGRCRTCCSPSGRSSVYLGTMIQAAEALG